MKRRLALVSVVAAAAAGCASVAQKPALSGLVQQVTDAETAFAKTMADRDFAAFMGLVADEAIFLNGGQPLRGKAAVGEHWKRFFTAAAPFAWQPDTVQVLDSGTLAQTAGPVTLPGGKLVARFHSIWRLDTDGRWRVVFDDGQDVCDCAAAKP